MIVSVHQPQYIHWLGYFDKIDLSDLFIFLDTVQYKKTNIKIVSRIHRDGSGLRFPLPIDFYRRSMKCHQP
ncbi:MAG: hypothetical protein CME25_07935 [Gemmatimonadetes bacterium]|nr:hypothetical protein [Gemmatimonadota bacterium]